MVRVSFLTPGESARVQQGPRNLVLLELFEVPDPNIRPIVFPTIYLTMRDRQHGFDGAAALFVDGLEEEESRLGADFFFCALAG